MLLHLMINPMPASHAERFVTFERPFPKSTS
jgi:hypothetical protein